MDAAWVGPAAPMGAPRPAFPVPVVRPLPCSTPGVRGVGQRRAALEDEMNLRQARKTRARFYRAFHALETWSQYKWERDQGPILRDVMAKYADAPADVPPPVFPPSLRKMRRWPAMPSNDILHKALRKLDPGERLAWQVDFALYNTMVRFEREPQNVWSYSFPTLPSLAALAQAAAQP